MWHLHHCYRISHGQLKVQEIVDLARRGSLPEIPIRLGDSYQTVTATLGDPVGRYLEDPSRFIFQYNGRNSTVGFMDNKVSSIQSTYEKFNMKPTELKLEGIRLIIFQTEENTSLTIYTTHRPSPATGR